MSARDERSITLTEVGPEVVAVVAVPLRVSVACTIRPPIRPPPPASSSASNPVATVRPARGGDAGAADGTGGPYEAGGTPYQPCPGGAGGPARGRGAGGPAGAARGGADPGWGPTRAGVGHLDARLVVLAPQPQPHGSTGRGVRERVAHQIPYHLPEAGLVGQHRQRAGVRRYLQRDVPVRRHRAGRGHRVVADHA